MSARLAPSAALLGIVLLAPALAAQGANPVNLWSAELRWRGDRLEVGTPVKLTRDQGINSQPSFSADGRAVVFSAVRDTGPDARSDIYRIDVETRRETRITRTPENENSPTVTASGEYMAVRWVPATLFKEFGPWRYTPDGTPDRAILPGPDTTGYYTPLPDGAFALVRPKSRAFTVALFDPRIGTIADIDSGVPALPARLVPGARALTYVRIDSAGGRHTIWRYDLDTRRLTRLGPAIPGRTSHAWVPGKGAILMARGNVLYVRRAGGDEPWRAVATFASPELRNAAAYAVSPTGDRLILTSPVRPPLAVLVRDSLDAGRSAAEVAAMVRSWSEGARLGEYDVAEGPLAAIGDERLQRKLAPDAVEVHALVTTLFPTSHRAQARLGDARRAAGDSAAAAAAYRKALELNPRATDADRRAAEAVERKLAGPG